jgi:hypothetical protein
MFNSMIRTRVKTKTLVKLVLDLNLSIVPKKVSFMKNLIMHLMDLRDT